jgi:hypothetical protein
VHSVCLEAPGAAQARRGIYLSFCKRRAPQLDQVTTSMATGSSDASACSAAEGKLQFLYVRGLYNSKGVSCTCTQQRLQWRGHRYFVANDDIVIIDRDRKIVETLPVGASASRSAKVEGGGAFLTFNGRAPGRSGIAAGSRPRACGPPLATAADRHPTTDCRQQKQRRRSREDQQKRRDHAQQEMLHHMRREQEPAELVERRGGGQRRGGGDDREISRRDLPPQACRVHAHSGKTNKATPSNTTDWRLPQHTWRPLAAG